jgi:predicted DNA-binding transcriptional regulator
MKNITSILQSLGLLESEIKTYQTLLNRGAMTVIDISKKTGLSRQATYVAIAGLTDRGLMTSRTQGKKSLYAAEHPENLLAYARRKRKEMDVRIDDLETAVPEIAMAMGGDKPVVKVYEGKEGLKAIIEDIKRTEFEGALELTDLEAMNVVLTQEDLADMREEVKKKKPKVRGLYAGTPYESPNKGERFYLPKKDSGFKSSISIHGDKIKLITFEGKMVSVTIESKHLADAMEILFKYAFRGVESEGMSPQ